MIVPARLLETCGTTTRGAEWLRQLPDIVGELANRWSLDVASPFDSDEVSCAWVAPVVRSDGTAAVLKVGMPHFEAAHEIEGLRFWNGNPTVRLLDSDDELNVMLLEACVPGTALRQAPEPEQDRIIASLLRRLWRMPPSPHPFRLLSDQLSLWADEALAHIDAWPDPGLVEAGLTLFRELPQSAQSVTLLATDLHAGNVLRAQREPWLVIDPKPFIGDPAYDATQHLLNCRDRLRDDVERTIRGLADLLEISHERVRLWTFARLAVASAHGAYAAADAALARGVAP